MKNFNGWLRDECLNETMFDTLSHARSVLDDWSHDYNHKQPHSAHSGKTPAAFATQTVMGHAPSRLDHPARHRQNNSTIGLYFWLARSWAEGYRLHTYLGYEVGHLEEVSESTRTPNGWTPHFDYSERSPDRYPAISPFPLFAVLRRCETFDDTHGPQRLAILFVGGDGFATFDALYCQNDGTPAPFLIVVQDHGFG